MTLDLKGQTTLITGASSGIGREFARECAARGSNLILVARRRERLDELAAELRDKHGASVATIPLDLARPDAAEELAKEVDHRGLTVTSLINSAGLGSFGPFHEDEPSLLKDELAVDVCTLVGITRAFIDQLRSGTGILINVASMAAYQGNPKMAVYGAAKAFVLSFTEALWYESRSTGLKVLAVSPGATRTEFFDVVGTLDAAGGARLQTTQAVVDTAFTALSRRNPPPSIAVGRGNRAFLGAAKLMSRRRLTTIIGGLTTPKNGNA
jgi:short-subunit dehydrogenase